MPIPAIWSKVTEAGDGRRGIRGGGWGGNGQREGGGLTPWNSGMSHTCRPYGAVGVSKCSPSWCSLFLVVWGRVHRSTEQKKTNVFFFGFVPSALFIFSASLIVGSFRILPTSIQDYLRIFSRLVLKLRFQVKDSSLATNFWFWLIHASLGVKNWEQIVIDMRDVLLPSASFLSFLTVWIRAGHFQMSTI